MRWAISKLISRAARLSFVPGSLISLSFPVAAQSITTCVVFGTPQVSAALVSLENRTSRSIYRKGERIRVKLTLRAGSKGVYLPGYFGPFTKTCSHGFASEVLTPEGKTANPHELGCAYMGPPPEVAYVELKAGETRTWSTTLETKSIARGRYCLYAEYLSFQELLATGHGLPEDRRLVASGRITAWPMPIEVR